jgi:hypothetical protein
LALSASGIHDLDAFRMNTRQDNPVLNRASHDVRDRRQRKRGQRLPCRTYALRGEAQTGRGPHESERGCASSVGVGKLAHAGDRDAEVIPARDAGKTCGATIGAVTLADSRDSSDHTPGANGR